MSEATRAAAAAVLAAADQKGSLFPTIGKVRRLTPVFTGGLLSQINDLSVVIDGDTYLCKWSGAFGAEVALADGAGFVGRQVKVEKLGQALVVAYTVNGSD